MAKLVRGERLSASQRREVLNRYVHRHLDPTLKDDDAWLKSHAFWIRKDGHLDERFRHCEPACLADLAAMYDELSAEEQ